MSYNYDVAIIGAGPAGLFTAYEVIKKNPKLKVVLMDKGKLAENRGCPMKTSGKCANCVPCQILSGYGGAGTFSDGKLNFIPKLGKSDLFKYMSESEAYKLIDETEEIFNQFGMDAEVYPKSSEESERYKELITLKGARLLLIKQKHLGSDNLPTYIKNFTDYIRDQGVEVLEDTDVTDIVADGEGNEVKYKVRGKELSFTAKYAVVAPGRTGAEWTQKLLDRLHIPYNSQSIEIGVRVETRKEVLRQITDVIYDPTIFIKTKTYGDEIRTFCTNPGGYVTKENYNGYICVNGHALKNEKSNNSNFAFISKVNLTEPVTNTREFGESIARIANVLGDKKPIIQTLRDLRNGRRSDWHRINKGFVEPTLKDCVAGDLALVMPYRIVTNILEGLEELDKIIPGVNNDETLLYGPEIKFFSNEVETDNKFKAKDKNIYFIGDGAGKSGNIVVAAATGLVAARDIADRIEK